MGVCNCSMFCCTLLYVHSSIAIILRGKRELVALLYLSSWCLAMVERLFLAVPQGCLQFVIVVFPDHTHYFWLEKPGNHYIGLNMFIYSCFNHLSILEYSLFTVKHNEDVMSRLCRSVDVPACLEVVYR